MILSFLVVNDRYEDDKTWDVSVINDVASGFSENYLGRMSRETAACVIGEHMLNAQRVSKVAWENLGPDFQAYVLGSIKPAEWGPVKVMKHYQFWAMFNEEAQT